MSMDLRQLNEQLRALHGRIAINRTYREQARASGNEIMVFQLDREIREDQTEAQALERKIDGLNSGEVQL